MNTTSRRRQRGATLLITMLMLLVVTLVGLSAIRSAASDERGAGALRDRDRAFQAAEAAVQTCLGELRDETWTGPKLAPAANGEPPRWEVASLWTDGNSKEVQVAADLAASGLDAWPRCLVETLGSDNYRVTGRAVGGSATTVVMLQATYAME